MSPDDFIEALSQIRTQVQVMHAKHVLAMVEVEQDFQAAMERINQSLEAAHQANALQITMAAAENRVTINHPSERQNRYFGTVIECNGLGILIKCSENHAVFIPKSQFGHGLPNYSPELGKRVVAERDNQNAAFTVKPLP